MFSQLPVKSGLEKQARQPPVSGFGRKREEGPDTTGQGDG